MEKICDEYCLDCKFFGGPAEFECCCNYFLTTDKRRPCPPGTGCTVKIKRKNKRKFGKNSIINRKEKPQKTKKEKEPVIKRCPVCGKEFLLNRPNKKYCDYECYRIANNREHCEKVKVNKVKVNKEPRYGNCKLCGKEFLVTAPNKLYCSEYCQRKNMRISKAKMLEESSKKSGVEDV